MDAQLYCCAICIILSKSNIKMKKFAINQRAKDWTLSSNIFVTDDKFLKNEYRNNFSKLNKYLSTRANLLIPWNLVVSRRALDKHRMNIRGRQKQKLQKRTLCHTNLLNTCIPIFLLLQAWKDVLLTWQIGPYHKLGKCCL